MTENQFYLLVLKVIATIIAPWQILLMVVPSETIVKYDGILNILFYLDVAIGVVYFMLKTSKLEKTVSDNNLGTTLSHK